jgi:hypothetical protein
MWVASGVSITRTISNSIRDGSTSNSRRPAPNSTGMWEISSSSSTPASSARCAVNAPCTNTLRSPAAALACAIALTIPSGTYVTRG